MSLLAIVNASPTPPPVPGAGLFPQPFLLSLFIWTPVVMAVVLGLFPNPRGRYDQLIRQVAFFTNLILLGLMFIGYNQFENFLPTMQYEEKVPWLPALGVSYHLGVDGPGLVMLMLAGLAGVISVIAS
jgi:NADH-quinone oxidoreductase subunit M